MKLIIEVLLAVFLHPIAFVLCLVNILGRNDLSGTKKIVWILISFVWGIGPILYVVLADGRFW